MGNIRRLGGGGSLVTRPHPLGLRTLYGPPRLRPPLLLYTYVCLSLVRIITAYCTVMGCRVSRSAPKDDAKARRRHRKELYRISASFDASTDVQSSTANASRSALSSTPTPVPSSPPPIPSSSSAPSSPSVSKYRGYIDRRSH